MHPLASRTGSWLCPVKQMGQSGGPGCVFRLKAAETRCGPWFDKLTMRPKPFKSLYLILSLSKDEGRSSCFFSSPQVRVTQIGHSSWGFLLEAIRIFDWVRRM